MIDKIKKHFEENSGKYLQFLQSNLFHISIMLGAVFLRVYQYVLNRSLWGDESSLSLNIIDKNWAELMQPLDYNQGAPIGFLWIQKLNVIVFGTSEYALRLFPLIAGILSIILFYLIIRKIFTPGAVSFGLILFGLSEPLIYYSSEVKQYSLDVLVALILILVSLNLYENSGLKKNWFALAAAGFAAVWFSHSSVIVLAGMGSMFMLLALIKKDWASFWKMAGSAVLWLSSFAILYFLSYKNLLGNDYLTTFWEDGFMPLTPSFRQAHWLVSTYFDFFGYSPIGMSLPEIGSILVPVGLIFLVISGRFKTAALIVSPVIAGIIISALEFYPFHGRMILFIFPLITIMTTAGFDWFLTLDLNPKKIIISVLVIISIAHPLKVASINFKDGRKIEEFRPMLEFVQENMEEGDFFFVYPVSRYPFKYYQRQLDFYPEDLVVFENKWRIWVKYVNYFKTLDGHPRVWVIMSHFGDEDQLLHALLDSMGDEQLRYRDVNAQAFLFDLSTQQPFNCRQP